MGNENMKNWIEVITLIAALIGAAAWLQQPVFDYFRKAEIHGKIISNYGSKSNDGNILYLLKLSIFSENKTFYLKDIGAFVKFPGSEKELKCKPWTWRKAFFTFAENGKEITKQLQIDSKEYLLHFTIFPNDQTVVGYFAFSVGYSKDEMFDYIRFIFDDYSGHSAELKITKAEIQDNKLIFDDNIWK